MKQQQEQMCNCRHTEDKRAKISSMSILVNTGRTSSPFFSALDKFINIHISKAPTWLGILWAFCDLRGLYSHWRLRFHSRAYRLHTIFVMKLLNFLSGQYQVQEMDICPPISSPPGQPLHTCECGTECESTFYANFQPYRLGEVKKIHHPSDVWVQIKFTSSTLLQSEVCPTVCGSQEFLLILFMIHWL